MAGGWRAAQALVSIRPGCSPVFPSPPLILQASKFLTVSELYKVQLLVFLEEKPKDLVCLQKHPGLLVSPLPLVPESTESTGKLQEAARYGGTSLEP